MSSQGILEHSTCSHKWWETLKGSIFSVKHSIPALKGSGGSLVVASAEKASLLESQSDSKQCHEQFVTPLSCFHQSRNNSFSFQTSVILHLLLDLDTHELLILWVCFLYFIRRLQILLVHNKA